MPARADLVLLSDFPAWVGPDLMGSRMNQV
jgi:hypothetical protein